MEFLIGLTIFIGLAYVVVSDTNADNKEAQFKEIEYEHKLAMISFADPINILIEERKIEMRLEREAIQHKIFNPIEVKPITHSLTHDIHKDGLL